MRYRVLFQVEVLHDYFLSLGSRVHEALEDGLRDAAMARYSVAGFLKAAPTAHTASVLSGHQMRFKATASGFLVGVKLDPEAVDDRPMVPLGDGFRLSFALRISDARFFNYTALAQSAPGFYRFSNESANDAEGGRFLSLPVPGFDADRSYEAGEVYADSLGATIDLFRAVRDTGPSASPVGADWERIPPDSFDSAASYVEGAVVLEANRIFRAAADLAPGSATTDPLQWQPVGALANQYVTAADSRRLMPGLFDLDLSGAALSQATVRVVREGASAMVWERHYTAESGDLGMVQLDLRGLAAGSCRLEVLDGSQVEVSNLGFDFYLDPEAVGQNWFGVIEIAAGSGDMSLLDGSGALRSPRFTLRFLNRATRWRYIFPDGQATGTGAEVVAEGGPPDRILVTAEPRPLTRFGAGVRLQADDPNTQEASEEVLLPKPEANRIQRLDEQWFSEVHMSNLRL